MGTTSGESVLSVALLQDIAAIPILALVPLLAGSAPRAHGGAGGRLVSAAHGVGVIARRSSSAGACCCARRCAGSRAAHARDLHRRALLLVVATAALMQAVGLSMALGAFLAGVLLAESEYRRELETDIEPFKGLLLGLFFIAVGMSDRLRGRARRGRCSIAAVVRRLPAAQGRRALGDGPRDADPAGRAAGVHHPARAGRRVRLRRLPDRGAGRRDRRRRRRRCWSPRWRSRCC